MLHQTIDTTALTARRPCDCTFEMGASTAEFLRQLKCLAPAGEIRVDAAACRARLVCDGGMVTVAWRPCPPRRTGALTIPVTEARIRFQDVSETGARAFLARWDRNFLRMGG